MRFFVLLTLLVLLPFPAFAVTCRHGCELMGYTGITLDRCIESCEESTLCDNKCAGDPEYKSCMEKCLGQGEETPFQEKKLPQDYFKF